MGWVRAIRSYLPTLLVTIGLPCTSSHALCAGGHVHAGTSHPATSFHHHEGGEHGEEHSGDHPGHECACESSTLVHPAKAWDCALACTLASAHRVPWALEVVASDSPTSELAVSVVLDSRWPPPRTGLVLHRTLLI